MTPVKPLPLLIPVTSTRSPALEHVGGDDEADFVAREVVDAELGEMAERLGIGGLQVSERGLGEPARL